jgi:hypothetical protein
MTGYGLFSTRTMIQALEEMFPPERFLLDTFYHRTEQFTTEYVDIDFYKGARTVAGYVSPEQEGNVVGRIGYQTFSYRPPYIKEKMAMKPSDMLNRRFGTTIYQAESPLQRAARQLALDMQYLDDTISRAEELQASQGLFQGQLQLLDGNWLIFPQAPTHQIDALEFDWTDTVNSDPLADLIEWHDMVARDSGIVPDTVIMGTDVIKAYINHPKVANNTAALSSIRVERGQIDPKVLGKGVTYYGYIAEIDCDIYKYNSYYVPSNAPQGTQQIPMVPLNALLMASSNMRADQLYGPILDMEADDPDAADGVEGSLEPFRRFPKSWVTKDPSRRWIMLQSSPLMIPTQVDAYMFAYPVAAPAGQLG